MVGARLGTPKLNSGWLVYCEQHKPLLSGDVANDTHTLNPKNTDDNRDVSEMQVCRYSR